MYNNKFVAAIRHNEKILREDNDKVYLPFKSEYSIFLKNLHPSLKAVAHVYIDGTDVTSTGIIIDASSSIILERSLANKDLKKGNKFLFISRTKKIEDHRGIQVEDGLVRVEFQFEKEKIAYPTNPWSTAPYPSIMNPFFLGQTISQNCSSSSSVSSTVLRSASISPSSYSVQLQSSTSSTGITVAGSESNQSFKVGENVLLDGEVHSIIFHLLGETASSAVIKKPITTKSKKVCSSCGKNHHFKAKFCTECGTALLISDVVAS